VYALGVVLYEMLTGQPPFEGASEFATAAARLDADPVPPRRLRPGIPPSLERVVLRALARHPEDRPQTAADLRTELATVDLLGDPDLQQPALQRVEAGCRPDRPARRAACPPPAPRGVADAGLGGPGLRGHDARPGARRLGPAGRPAHRHQRGRHVRPRRTHR